MPRKFKYASVISDVDQRTKIPGTNMVQNNAGGFVFEVNPWVQLRRFLILGSEGGSYYVKEEDLTLECSEVIINLIRTNGRRVVEEIADVSKNGLAAKNDPAIFCLALCFTHGNDETKMIAKTNFPDIVRTGTHLFQFCDAIKKLRGWGPAIRKTISTWYKSKNIKTLSYQMAKYRQRGGWTNRDVLRLNHVHPHDNHKLNDLFKWATGNLDLENLTEPEDHLTYPWCVTQLNAFEKKIQDLAKNNQTIESNKLAKIAKDTAKNMIEKYGLSWEMIPSILLDEKIWETIFPNLPMTALIRNLGNLTSYGILSYSKESNVKLAVEKITNDDILQKAKIHPISILSALKIYSQGFGKNNQWTPIPEIQDALDDAFYKSFKFAKPIGKSILIGLDVSGSMFYNRCLGMNHLTAAEAGAAMTMYWKHTEDMNCKVMGFQHDFVDLGFTKKETLNSALERIGGGYFRATDCSLPMEYALENKIRVDAFVVITDNETWIGNIHPCKMLDIYRRKFGINSKLVVLATTPTNFSIADPKDPNTLDVVGFDASVPKILNEFIRME
ncbi:MAG: TROVE domain-containing protein [Candidatus Heimdallarchaeaceae archaeon]